MKVQQRSHIIWEIGYQTSTRAKWNYLALALVPNEIFGYWHSYQMRYLATGTRAKLLFCTRAKYLFCTRAYRHSCKISIWHSYKILISHSCQCQISHLALLPVPNVSHLALVPMPNSSIWHSCKFGNLY